MSDQAGEVTSSLNQSSVTNQTNSTNCDQVDNSAHPYLMIVYVLVFLVGLLLNSYVMKFYFCQAQQKASSSIMIYLKNLAAADFLLCLCLPIRIAHYASSSFTIRSLNCNFGNVILFLNMYASITFMGYIAANRQNQLNIEKEKKKNWVFLCHTYQSKVVGVPFMLNRNAPSVTAVRTVSVSWVKAWYLKFVQPSGTHILQTVRAARIISTVTWVVLLSITISYIIMSFLTQESFTYVPVSCDSLHSGLVNLRFKIINTCFTTMFLFILVSMLFFYYSISRRVLLAQQSQLTSFSSTKLAKSCRNMLVLVSVFCFCFVPYHLVRLPRVFLLSYCSWSKFLYYPMEVTIIMSVLNVCLDPLIYFILSKRFRTQFRLGVMSSN